MAEEFVIFALPFVCGIVAIGIAGVAQHLAAELPQEASIGWLIPWAVAAPALAAYGFLALPRTLALHHFSVDPRRESARAIRGGLRLTDPANSKILTAHVYHSALAYDPLGWMIRSASDEGQPDGSPPGLTRLMRIADTRGLTLYVNVGFPGEARQRYPDIMDLLETSEFFDITSRHFGLEPQFERAVYRYRGGVFAFDFSRPKP